jgi:hypothetical protein
MKINQGKFMHKTPTIFGLAVAISMSLISSTLFAISTETLIKQQAKKPASEAVLAALKITPYKPYSKIKYSLKKRTRIAILLPSADIVDHYIFAKTLTKSSIGFAKPNAYLIYFQWSKICNGAPICTSASVYGAKINRTMPYNSTQAPEITLNQTEPVMLDRDLMGDLTSLQTGKSASPFRTLSWDEGDIRYALSLKKNASVTEFTAIANSMIHNRIN